MSDGMTDRRSDYTDEEKAEMKKAVQRAKKEIMEGDPDEPVEVEFKQNFPFKEIKGELLRTYIFPNNQQIPVPNVRFFSESAKGHRLISGNNLTQGVFIPRGWLGIIYQGETGKPYTFTE